MSKIIIVDDSHDLLDVMKFFLEEKGFEVQTATKRNELVSLVKSFSPDLIILDIFLEGEDGREICKELRETKSSKYLCILMFSASPKAIGKYREYGADGYIEKPFGLNEIIERIESTIESCQHYHPHKD